MKRHSGETESIVEDFGFNTAKLQQASIGSCRCDVICAGVCSFLLVQRT